MSRSTRVEIPFTKEEFYILSKLIERIPDQYENAQLNSQIQILLDSVLGDNGIDPLSDTHYFSCLCRLKRSEGRTWRQKLRHATPAESSKTHRRYRSETVNGARMDRRELSNRSVIRQRLDEHEELAPSLLQRPTRPSTPVELTPELTAERSNALAKRYRLYNRERAMKLQLKVLLFWHEAARYVKAMRQEHWAYAASKDNGTLRRQAFDIWYSAWQDSCRFNAMQERKADLLVKHRCFRRWESRTIERKQGQHLAMKAAERKSQHQVLYKLVQNMIAGRRLRQWQSVLQKNDQKTAKAMDIHNRQMLVKSWKVWFLRACDRRTIEYRNVTTQRRNLHVWLSRARRYTSMALEARNLRNLNLIDTAISHWQIAYAGRETARSTSILFHSRKLQRARFDQWRMAAKNASRIKIIAANITQRRLRDTMVIWWNRLLDRQEIQAGVEMVRKKSLFQAWRRESQATYVLATRSEQLMHAHWTIWHTEFKVRSFQRRCSSDLVYRLLALWRRNTETIQDRLYDAEDAVVTIQDETLLKRVLGKFRSRRALLTDSANRADQVYSSTIVRFAFIRMRKVYEFRNLQYKRADKLVARFTNKLTFKSWRVAMYARRETIRQQKLDELLERRRMSVISEVFTAWHSRSARIGEISKVAEDIRHVSLMNQLRYFYTAWCDRKIDLFEMTRMAGEMEERLVARSLLHMLHDVYISRKADLELAKKFHDRTDCVRTVRQAYHRWRQAYGRSLERQEHLMLRSEQFQRRQRERSRLLLIRIWRQWMSLTPMLSARDDHSSLSFDGHTTLVPWDSSPDKNA